MTIPRKFSNLVGKLFEIIISSLSQKKYREFTRAEAEELGEQSEARVLKICYEMAVWEQLPPRTSGSLPRRTEKYSQEDLDQIDIVIPTDKGDIRIQVKSSHARLQEFISRPEAEEIICINGQREEIYLHKSLLKSIWRRYQEIGQLEAI